MNEFISFFSYPWKYTRTNSDTLIGLLQGVSGVAERRAPETLSLQHMQVTSLNLGSVLPWSSNQVQAIAASSLRWFPAVRRAVNKEGKLVCFAR